MGHRIAVLAAALLAVLPAAAAAATPHVRAGAAVVDATYHIGPSAGQYSSDRLDGEYGDFDPHMQQVKNRASYGVQSRNAAKALVVQGPDGGYVALVRNDHYISQDALWRRTAQILEAETGGAIGRRNLIMAVTHNHSSPYYSSLDWGVWTFQDVFDFRFFDYWARKQADAVKQAMADMHDVRVSATAGYFDKTQRNSMGPGLADDGTPAGFPKSVTDHDLSVIRFDDIDDPRRPRPLATLVNLGQHGESLDGTDLISGEWTQTAERLVDRSTGAITIFTQNATGTTEMERDAYHSIHERLLLDHAQYQQMEYGARLMADEVIDGWRDIGAQRPNPDDRPQEGQVSYHDRFVPWMTRFAVQIDDRWFGGPVSHPYPGVSSCRQDPTYQGDPRFPVVGLPDCKSLDDGLGELDFPIAPMRDVLDPLKQALPVQWPALSTDDLQALGIPVPENLSFPSSGALEDTMGIHLQALRLGDILLTMCSCEQWSDQSINIKTRTDTKPGNEWLGYDWSERCSSTGDGTWTCVDPRNTTTTLPPIPDRLFQRMRAQVRNDATGWDDPTCDRLGCGLQAESEPVDPAQIFGNYTHDDTPAKSQAPGYARTFGYRMTVPIGFANDYNGYIATYREYQRGDHYRKALTGWGPHSSDYMATRLVQMGHALKGDGASKAALDEQTDPAKGSAWAPIAAKELADQAAADARVRAVGEAASAGVKAYDATIPDDGGSASALGQPEDIRRFDAATFSWDGGTNYVDNPQVIVERKGRHGWKPFADQTGEIPLTLQYPGGASLSEPWTLAAAQAAYRQGGQTWRYTATFEAFVSAFDLVDLQGDAYRATPAGTYRFVVDGLWRKGGRTVAYRRESQPFEVRPWSGLTVEDARVEDDGRVTFRAGPSHTFTEKRARKTETPDLGPLTVTIGPVDFPDTVRDQKATGARFLDAERGYTAAARTDLEHYCLDCRFRPWADATDELIAFVTFSRSRGRVQVEAVGGRHGAFATKGRLAPGETATIEIQDAWGDFSGARALVAR